MSSKSPNGVFGKFIRSFTTYLGINSALWLVVYTGLLNQIPLLRAVVANMGLTYYQFWNSIVVISAVTGFIWVIVKS